MWDSPLMLEFEVALRRDEAKRRLAPRRPKPSSPRQASGWRRRSATRLVAIALWLDPGAARGRVKHRLAAR